MSQVDLRSAPPLPGQEVPGASEIMRRHAEVPASFLKGDGRMVYEKDVLYHGTNADSKRNIRELGFRLDAKTEGVSAFSKNTRREQARTNYFSIGKKFASKAARATARQTSAAPALVRVLGRDTMVLTPNHMNIGTSSTTEECPVEFRQNVPPGMVLQSKSLGAQESHETAAHFQRLMAHRAAITMTKAEAARLLHDVQSDSDDDFPTR